MKYLAYEVKVTGIVQGVGFRPFVYSLAKSLSLKGWVSNADSSVLICAEGDKEALQGFIERLKSEAPPLSRIKAVEVDEKPYKGFEDFAILQSSKGSEQNTYISPDVSICDECREELFDKGNPRYLYPFINCTNCGPRFTIVKGIPYDREFTTMDKFTMCSGCKDEYNDASDRRYHAQPISCYGCGPELTLLNGKGRKIDVDNIIKYTGELILDGKIIAVKGLGGYHLVCDAQNEEAVGNLRKRKFRDYKPFAVMAKDYGTALRYCSVDETERKLLESEKKPIVLLRRRKDMKLPENIAPGNPNLGVMLPYMPVHLLLFSMSRVEIIVMTSGNRSNEPVYYKDREAFENLKDIADFFLTNNRDIFIRTDDSVTRAFKGREYVIRRSRGYVPMPVTVNAIGTKLPSVLACGGELKNTFCLNSGSEFYLSHHIGDLENAETFSSFEEGIEHFKKLFNINYRAVAYDLHPEYLSTKYAEALKGVEKIALQHHHAHIASCMAENNIDGEIIGVAFDGTGYGEDGNIWGGEFFTGGYKGFKREGALKYISMPGGEMAVKEPWRMAVSYLCGTFGDIYDKIDSCSGININGIKILGDIDAASIKTIIQMIRRGLNSPLTSSMGRLFDAVSAILGIVSRANYDGQAAAELEYSVKDGFYGAYAFSADYENGILRVNTLDIMEGILKDIANNVDRSVIAARFHETAAVVVARCCEGIRKKTGLNRVALSGGVFQNMTLLNKCVSKLKAQDFIVFVHSTVPANDGGIALGQAALAAARLM